MAAASLTSADVEELEKALAASPKDSAVQRKLLACLRVRKTRRPDLVIRCGLPLLAKSSLGKAEVWDVREQVLVGALELHMFDEANKQLKLLEEKFSNSKRVKVLKAMLMEALAGQSKMANQDAEGLYNDAVELYQEILKDEPANAIARKRKICTLRGIGSPESLTEALKQMNEYLNTFPTDADAWRELADMYLDVNNVEAAKFAFEEVLMLSPINYINHTLLADCLYTLGDYATARKYYAQSLELKPTENARAAMGMILCTTAINNSRSSRAEDKENNVALFECGKLVLLQTYGALGTSDKGAQVGTFVKSWLHEN